MRVLDGVAQRDRGLEFDEIVAIFLRRHRHDLAAHQFVAPATGLRFGPGDELVDRPTR